MLAAGHWQSTSSLFSTLPPKARKLRRIGPTSVMIVFQPVEDANGGGQGPSRIASSVPPRTGKSNLENVPRLEEV